MSDLISRQAAIDFIAAGHLCNPNEPRWSDNEVVNFLKSRPSAQRTGRWIRKSNWMWTCSCCGSDNAYAYKADDAYELTVLQDFFCPNCGAKMEVEE